MTGTSRIASRIERNAFVPKINLAARSVGYSSVRVRESKRELFNEFQEFSFSAVITWNKINK